tara:strand:+ start:4929 stop:6986 length:2058 start_codon:yes stop_codon:yes gene_type:complete
MPAITSANKNYFKSHIKLYRKKFTSPLQELNLSDLENVFNSTNSSLVIGNQTVKVGLFGGKEGDEVLDISSLSNGELLYLPGQVSDYVNLKTDDSRNIDTLFFQSDNSVRLLQPYNDSYVGLYNGYSYTIGAKKVTVQAIGGLLLSVEDGPTYSITHNVPVDSFIPDYYAIDEGDQVTFTITTTNFENGSGSLYWYLDGTIDSNDFESVFGSVYISNNTGTVTVTSLLDNLNTQSDYFRLVLRKEYNQSIVAQSDRINLLDTIFTVGVTPSVTTINEGDSNGVIFTVNTTGLEDGFSLYYKVTDSSELSALDLPSNSYQGSFSIYNDTGTFIIRPKEDLLVEPSETFTVDVKLENTYGNKIVATSVPVTVVNTTSFAISADTTLPTEGDTITLTVTTTGVPNGTQLYFKTVGVAGTEAAADVTPNKGFFTITNNTGTFTISSIQEYDIESSESLEIQVRTGWFDGPVVATTNTLTLTDKAFSISVIPDTTVILESTSTTNSTLNVNITSVDVLDGSIFNAVLVGPNITAKDFGGTITYPFTINNNASSFVIPIERDARTEGPETFVIEVRNQNNNKVARSGTIVITDSSYLGMQVTGKTFGPILVNRDENNDANVSDWFTICGLDSLPSGSKVALVLDNSGSMTTDTVRKSFELFLSKCQAQGIEVIASEPIDEDWITPFDKNFS